MSRFENVHNVHALMSLHYYILTFNLIVLGLTLQALGPKFISHLLESIFFLYNFVHCFFVEHGCPCTLQQRQVQLDWLRGCLENSDLETSDLRPQTSKLQTP